MASPSYNSPTAQERWSQFSAAAVRAFHRYATWLVSLSWWRFGWYALLLVIVTGLIQKLPPFSMTYYETIVESARHHKAKTAPVTPPASPAMPSPPAPAAPAAPVAQAAPPAPPVQVTKTPGANADESKTVDINLPGITVNTKDRTVKNKGVNISFTGNGIHISSDEDDAQDNAARAAEAAASAAAHAASTAAASHAIAQTAKSRAEAAHYAATAERDAALAQALAAKAAAEQAHANALGANGAASAAAAQPAAAASAAAQAASDAAVDIVVGGQHIRIGVPAHANSDEVRDAINEAKQSIVESLKDAAAARKDADQEAADRAKEALDAAKAKKDDDGNDDDNDEQSDTDSDGHRNTTREHTVHYGNLPMLAVWWILGSMLVKITYKGRIQAEVKAAVATETAEAESLRRQVLEARMAMMQAQVEPHFLFNTLASIDHLIEFDPKRASQMQRNLISLLRASMPSMRTATESGLRPLDLELAVVRPYLEILKVRMEERLTTDIDIPDGLLSAEFPPMMVQTLVENSIKHGLEPKAEGGHLAVKAEIRHGKLCVTVTDTGLGFAGAASGETAGTGVGLANIRERLSLLYGNKGTLTIANNPVGGTIVTITVPYTAHTDPAGDEGAKT
jgi:hypothetical protein